MKFRLQTVLEHRQKREDIMKQRMAVATSARVRAEGQLQALVEAERARRELLSATLLNGAAKPGDVREHATALESFAALITLQQVEVARARAFEEQERAMLTQATVERKALDTMRERHELRERQEANRKESLLLDELATSRAARVLLDPANIARRMA